MKRFILLLGALVLCMGQADPSETSNPPQPPAAASAPADDLPDLLTSAVDPYEPPDQRAKFYKAAGADSELSKEEFEADAAREGSFVRKFDRWKDMLKFDANANGKIDWFEADAYRKAVRAAILQRFDADKDGRLTGQERTQANRALHQGKLALPGGKASPADQPRADAPSTPGQAAPASTQPTSSRSGGLLGQAAQTLKLTHFDADGDGKLDEKEQAAYDEFMKDFQKIGKEWELAQMDLDGDGKISLEERQEAGKQWQGMAIKIMAKSVKYMDADGDGKVSAEERQAFTKKVQEKLVKWLDDFIAQYDRNADGKLLSAEERKDFLEGLSKDLAARRKKFDADKDGRLSPEETIAMIEDFLKEIGVEPPATQPAEQ